MFCSNFQTVEQAMESHAQSVQDNLIASLSFKSRLAADLSVLSVKPAYANTKATAGNLKLHYVLRYGSITQIMDSGISVLE